MNSWPAGGKPLEKRSPDDVRRMIEAVWRIESSKIIASLSRYVDDFDLAEDLAHDAL